MTGSKLRLTKLYEDPWHCLSTSPSERLLFSPKLQSVVSVFSGRARMKPSNRPTGLNTNFAQRWKDRISESDQYCQVCLRTIYVYFKLH